MPYGSNAGRGLAWPLGDKLRRAVRLPNGDLPVIAGAHRPGGPGRRKRPDRPKQRTSNYGGSAPNVLKQLQWLYVADVEQTYDQCKNAPPRDHIEAWADLAAGPKALCKKFGPLPPSKKHALRSSTTN
jgi:hypothetical protein